MLGEVQALEGKVPTLSCPCARNPTINIFLTFERHISPQLVYLQQIFNSFEIFGQHHFFECGR